MDTENPILRDLTFDGAQGAILYKDVRYLLIRPETLVAFQKAAEEQLGAAADDLLFTGGFTGGTLSGKKYREVFGLTEKQSVEFMAKMGTEIGWGKLEIARFEPRGELVLTVASSPFAAAYGKADRGVCHLIRGVFAGLACGLWDRPVQAREDECLAMGYAHCQFSVRAV